MKTLHIDFVGKEIVVTGKDFVASPRHPRIRKTRREVDDDHADHLLMNETYGTLPFCDIQDDGVAVGGMTALSTGIVLVPPIDTPWVTYRYDASSGGHWRTMTYASGKWRPDGSCNGMQRWYHVDRPWDYWLGNLI